MEYNRYSLRSHHLMHWEPSTGSFRQCCRNSLWTIIHYFYLKTVKDYIRKMIPDSSSELKSWKEEWASLFCRNEEWMWRDSCLVNLETSIRRVFHRNNLALIFALDPSHLTFPGLAFFGTSSQDQKTAHREESAERTTLDAKLKAGKKVGGCGHGKGKKEIWKAKI